MISLDALIEVLRGARRSDISTAILLEITMEDHSA